jgi:predicted transcriptional regulator
MKLEKIADQIKVWSKLPPPEYLVENLFIQNSINIIAAPSNAGKTLIATELYIALGTGGTFFGRKVKKSTVVYFDLELQHSLYFLRLRKQHKADLPSNMYYVEDRIDCMDDNILKSCADKMIEAGVEVMIVDSYSQWCVGLEENSNSQHAIVLAQLIKLQNRGLTLIFLAHTRKGPTSANPIEMLRGGSVIGSGASTILYLEKQVDTYRLRQIKDRLLPTEEWLDVFFRFKNNEEGELKPQLMEDANINNTLSAQIISHLEDTPYASGNDISKAVSAQRSTVSSELKKLVEIGAIKQDPQEPRKGQRVKYYLPEDQG